MTTHTVTRQSFSLIAIILFLAKCSPSHSLQPNSTPTSVHEATKQQIQDGWVPKQSEGSFRYSIYDSSVVTIGADSIHSLRTNVTTIYSFTLTPLSDSFTLHAKVESVRNNARTQIQKIVVDTSISPEFQAIISSTGHISSLTGNKATSCVKGIDPTATRIFELRLEYPRKRIKIGDKWSDTVSTITCRGKTPLIQQNIRSYELIEFSSLRQRNVAKIYRTVSAVFKGKSTDPKNHLTVNGSGTNESMLYTDQTTGVLLESNGSSHFSLIVRTSRGIFLVTQSLITHLQLQ